MLEILWRSMAQDFGYNKSLLVFLFLFFSWPMERYSVISMHNVHNTTHLFMNKVTHS
jgi:hypothetical protein